VGERGVKGMVEGGGREGSGVLSRAAAQPDGTCGLGNLK